MKAGDDAKFHFCLQHIKTHKKTNNTPTKKNSLEGEGQPLLLREHHGGEKIILLQIRMCGPDKFKLLRDNKESSGPQI